MSSITFYGCTDDNSKLNKSLTYIKTATANFKGQVSVTDPVLFVEQFNHDNVNYMYIDDYDRYYFITEIVAVPGGLQIKGHVDVLMSFKEDILNVGGIVARSTTYSNPYITDYNMRTLQYNDYDVIPAKVTDGLENGFSHYIVVAG